MQKEGLLDSELSGAANDSRQPATLAEQAHRRGTHHRSHRRDAGEAYELIIR